MFDDPGRFPNIINKKKLAPLPLFRQNISPQRLNLNSTKNATSFGINSRSAGFLPGMLSPSTSKSYLNDFKAVNNYGRLCDQPFLECSTFHLQQVFGSGSGKKKIQLSPLKQKKEFKKISKVGTIRTTESHPRFAAKPPVKVQEVEEIDEPSVEEKQQEVQEQEVEEQEIPDPNNQAIIKKVYKVDQHEAMVGFTSLEVVLTESGKPHGKTISTFLGKNDLKKIYEHSDEIIAEVILKSLVYKDGDLKIRIKGDNLGTPDATDNDEPYPEKKGPITVNLQGESFDATIIYPYLEISIAEIGFAEKLPLKPRYLANLYDADFDNLEDYIGRFNLPASLFQTPEETHKENLRNLPTIIKKVIKTADFGGLMLFKTLEIHLKNTSESQPKIMIGESSLSPTTKHMVRRKKKDMDTVLLRMNLADLEWACKCTPEELVELVKASINVEEGQGFKIVPDKDLQAKYVERDDLAAEAYPETSGKFLIRFNKFVYETSIKFPTLELYIPETNFKNVQLLKPSQIQDLLKAECANMENYLDQFKHHNDTGKTTDNQEAAQVQLIKEKEEVQSKRESQPDSSPTERTENVAVTEEKASARKSAEQPEEKTAEEKETVEVEAQVQPEEKPAEAEQVASQSEEKKEEAQAENESKEEANKEEVQTTEEQEGNDRVFNFEQAEVEEATTETQ